MTNQTYYVIVDKYDEDPEFAGTFEEANRLREYCNLHYPRLAPYKILTLTEVARDPNIPRYSRDYVSR